MYCTVNLIKNKVRLEFLLFFLFRLLYLSKIKLPKPNKNTYLNEVCMQCNQDFKVFTSIVSAKQNVVHKGFPAFRFLFPANLLLVCKFSCHEDTKIFSAWHDSVGYPSHADAFTVLYCSHTKRPVAYNLCWVIKQSLLGKFFVI